MHADPSGATPQLLGGSGCEHLYARWSGDAELDAMLACDDVPSAVAQLFGSARATRAIVKGLARALLGPTTPDPGPRNAALFTLSLLLALDDADDTDGGAFVTDDLAAVLAVSTEPDVPARRQPIPRHARELLAVLVEFWPRRRRRDLAIEMIRDRSGRTEELLRWLRGIGRGPEQVFPTSPQNLRGLLDHVRFLAAAVDTSDSVVRLGGVVRFLSSPRVRLESGFEVRVATSVDQAATMGVQLHNCMGARFAAVAQTERLLATVHHRLDPIAALELDEAGDIVELRGPSNTQLSPAEWKRVEQLLLRAEVLAHPCSDRPLVPADRVAARIACRTAVLLSHDLAPEPDRFAGRDTDLGDRALELLGRRANLLTTAELHHLRTVREPLSADQDRHACLVIGSMMAVSGVSAPDIVRLDGGASFRLEVAEHARRILSRTLELEHRPPDPVLAQLVGDPALPGPVREGLGEVAAIWWPATHGVE